MFSKQGYGKHFSDVNIHKSETVFKIYPGDLFSPVGSIFIDVELHGHTFSNLELFVVN